MTRTSTGPSGNWLITNHGEANQILNRTVWSTPQIHAGSTHGVGCGDCKFFVNTGTKVSALARDYEPTMTFGFCQNISIWAAFGREKPPITRSYHYCNYFEGKEKEYGM